ncbi:MAG: elongation factor P, partial [Deltaproteobacteria bacterium]|nr:elongation factor P [Deltaproteobacteria bacterium]
MALDTSDFRNGLKIDLDGSPYVITYFQHVKPGKCGAFVRTKVKNLLNGKSVDKTFRSGEKLKEADVEERTMQYLYKDGEDRIFMDSKNYDQIPITDDV